MSQSQFKAGHFTQFERRNPLPNGITTKDTVTLDN